MPFKGKGKVTGRMRLAFTIDLDTFMDISKNHVAPEPGLEWRESQQLEYLGTAQE